MSINSDVIQALFWSITYLLFIIYSLKNKTHGISLVSIVLNFSWETNALSLDIVNRHASWIHLLWFSLDLIIIYLALKYLKDKKKTIYTFLMFFICFTVLNFVFKVTGGMLISCFIIDLIMAIDFHIFFKKTSLKVDFTYIIAAISKLVGDLFAWLYYESFSPIIFIIGIIVAYINIVYVFIVLESYKKDKVISST